MLFYIVLFAPVIFYILAGIAMFMFGDDVATAARYQADLARKAKLDH